MEFTIYLASKLVLFTALLCMGWCFKIGRVSLSLMIVCVVFTAKEMIDGNILNFYLNYKVDGMIAFAFWYIAFNITNFIAIFMIHIGHTTFPVRFSLAARFYIWNCILASTLVFARGIERIYFNTDYFEFLYLWVAPSTSYLFIGVLIYSLYIAHTRAKEFGERIAWNI